MNRCEYCKQELGHQSYDWQGHKFDSENCRNSYQRDHGTAQRQQQ
jgi:hypothetical protein